VVVHLPSQIAAERFSDGLCSVASVHHPLCVTRFGGHESQIPNPNSADAKANIGAWSQNGHNKLAILTS